MKTTGRPSTSSGPGSSKMAGTRPNFDKRMSKDDLALMGMGMGKGRERGLQPYMTGAKGPGLLTPEPSPYPRRMPSPPAVLSPPARLLTPQSSTSGEIQIGMALGSPTRDSAQYPPSPPTSRPYFGWQPQSQVSVQISSSPSPAQTPEPPIQRTKTQKRRLFGSLFGRKQAEPPKAPEASDVNRSVSSTWVPGANNDAAPARSNTVRKTPKHKPIVIRSNTEPFSDAAVPQESWPSISGTSSSLSTNKPGLLDVEIPDIRLERYSVMFSGVLNANGTKSSLLERRQATLEKLKTISDGREDEMVEERTRPRRATSPQPGKSPAFSLFPQTPTRQSGVEAVSTSLAPPSRGLTRSNTSPAYLPSPARATFEAGQQPSAPEHLARKERKTVTIVSPRTMDERDRAAKVEKLREQQQQQQRQQAHQQHPLRSHPQPAMASTTATFHLDPDESALILDSPESISSPFSSPASSSYDSASSPQRAKPGPALIPSLRPTIPEPEWQILTPPSSTSSASTASNASTGTTTTTASTLSTTTTTPAAKRSRSATVSASTSTSTSASGSVRASRPSIDDDESTAAAAAALPRVSVDEQDAALKAAVESSIARQISISRQQRQLLMRPFGPGQGALSAGSAASSASGAGGKTGGASGGVAGGKNGKGKGAGVGLGLGGWENGYGNGQRQGHGQGQGQGQAQGQVTVGVIKGRVTPVMVGGGGAGDRRSERVVLDVVR